MAQSQRENVYLDKVSSLNFYQKMEARISFTGSLTEWKIGENSEILEGGPSNIWNLNRL